MSFNQSQSPTTFPVDYLPPEGEYESREALFEAINAWAATKGYAFITGRSTKEKTGRRTITYICDRRRNHPIVSRERRRKTTTRTTGCEFSILAKENKDGSTWTLRHRSDSRFSLHNHEPSQDTTAHPVLRTMSKEHLSQLTGLANAGIAPKEIRTYMRQNTNTIATQQDIYNRIADARREVCQGQSSINALADQLFREGFWSQFQTSLDGRVKAVLFAHPDSVAYLQAYPDVLILDCTYKTNKYGMPLLDLIGVDSCQLLRYCQPRFTRQAQRDNPGIEAWNEFYGHWHSIIKSPNEQTFHERVSEFERKYLPDYIEEVRYIKANWLDQYKEKLVKAWVNQHPHFDNVVTSRVKGIHWLLKSHLKVSTLDLFEAWRSIKHALLNQLAELKANQAKQKIQTPIELSGTLYGADSATVRQRLLQANHTRNYRNRQKARKDTAMAGQQVELLSDAIEPMAENGLLELENNSLPDTEEFGENDVSACDIFTISSQEVDDPTITTMEPDPYYEEEAVELYSAEEHEDQRQPQSPRIHTEERADLANDNANSDAEYTTQKFIQQFLASINGCNAQSHRESLTAHIEAEGPDNHHGLNRLVPHNVPHTLDKQHILAPEIDGEAMGLTPDQWQELFTGSATQDFDDKPKQACLHVERPPQTPPIISFDIDSFLGFVDSPAAAIHGVRFYSAPQHHQNIQTDVHLTFDRVAPDTERPRLLPSRLKDMPHFTSAKFSRWFDGIFYPAVRQVYGVDRLQHLPASYRHALATCRAPQVEDRLLETPSYRTQLRMSYFLSREGLQQLWDHVLTALRRPGLRDFRDPELFIEAKGTKLLFKYPDAPSDLLEVMENFDCKLHSVLDFSHICSDRLYVDVGKETCPLHSDLGTQVNSVSSPDAQTCLWRRCCIRHHLSQLYDENIPKSGQNFYH
ncbi:hypothetical protein NCS52_01552300 [Fusarium sp. LHS14.1]|nr:hypothetical protein NCS52_01552300 [Fusarium sp. LHS14.1]